MPATIRKFLRLVFVLIVVWITGAMLMTGYFFKIKHFPFWVYQDVPADKIGVPVITYHAVTNPDEFAANLKYLVDNGYRTLTCDELLAYLTGREKFDKAVMLTFDDGLLNLWEVVYPLLKRYHLKGVAFIAPHQMLDSDIIRPNMDDVRAGAMKQQIIPNDNGMTYLSWAEIKVMHASGVIDFQSHSFGHEKFWDNAEGHKSFGVDNQQDFMRAMSESFIKSKAILEEHLPIKRSVISVIRNIKAVRSPRHCPGRPVT